MIIYLYFILISYYSRVLLGAFHCSWGHRGLQILNSQVSSCFWLVNASWWKYPTICVFVGMLLMFSPCGRCVWRLSIWLCQLLGRNCWCCKHQQTIPKINWSDTAHPTEASQRHYQSPPMRLPQPTHEFDGAFGWVVMTTAVHLAWKIRDYLKPGSPISWCSLTSFSVNSTHKAA